MPELRRTLAAALSKQRKISIDDSSVMHGALNLPVQRLWKLLVTAAFGLSINAVIAGAQSIVVGPNVWVSSALPGAGHYEVTLAADPADSDLLLAGSMVWRSEKGRFHTAAYASSDGGKSWKQTLYVDRGLDTQDPTVAYGPNHAAYFASWGNDTSWDIRTLLFASSDGGKKWLSPTDITTLDREFITVDNTKGRYRGRIYVNGQDNDRFYDSDSSLSSIWISRFDSLLRPLEPKHYIATANHEITIPTNGIVGAGGSYLTGFVEHNSAVGSSADSVLTAPNATLKIIRSEDGGSRFGHAVVVATMFDKFGELNVSSIPWLAADVSPRSRFKGRLYAVWADRRSSRSEIWFARSEDGGEHWTSPARVNDDEARQPGRGPDDFRPLVAVNSAGVVGVMWYDRRDNPDDTGWWVRFAASMDGGETFSPSVRVSEAALDASRDTQPVISAITRGGGHPHPLLAGGPLRSDVVYSHFNLVGGHTAGLAASADGLFHPLWVDDRTGVSQIYTATIRVLDAGAKGARAADAELQNISQAVTLELSNARYIARDSLVTVTAVLRNTSRDTLRGPFELHILSLKSDFGEINDVSVAGAPRATHARVISLGSSKDPPLPPGGTLSSVGLVFHLAHPPHRMISMNDGTRLVGYGVTLVSLESHIFARGAAIRSTPH
jgi:hypothetical protein